MKRVKLPAVIATLLAVLATGPALAVESVFIQSRLDYNAILITGVDIIFVYDQQSLQAMPETKTDWYSGKRAFIEQAGDSADVVSIFVPQGFDSTMASLPERRDEALKVYVYGQHDASGAEPVDITSMDNVLVEIDQFGILVSSRD
ncbi:MAG: hypothetical protein PsegKO_16830 [Pseudohongiellaceae bacterium]|jgi:hypothetical protein